jgi:hypothetical protein
MAILAFMGAEKVEGLLGARHTVSRVRRYSFATIAALALLTALTIAVPQRAEATQRAATISANELAHKLVDEPWTVRVLDVRPNRTDRIPGAQSVSADSLAGLVDDGRTIVIVGDARPLPEKARVLAGGMAAWKADPFVKAMTSGAPPPPPPPSVPAGVITKPKKKGGGCST